MQLGHKTRPGHCTMQHWRFSNDWPWMCVFSSISYSTLFQSDLLPAPSEHVLHSCMCIMFLSALGRDLGTYGTWVSGVHVVKVGQYFAMWSVLLPVSWLLAYYAWPRTPSTKVTRKERNPWHRHVALATAGPMLVANNMAAYPLGISNSVCPLRISNTCLMSVHTIYNNLHLRVSAAYGTKNRITSKA